LTNHSPGGLIMQSIRLMCNGSQSGSATLNRSSQLHSFSLSATRSSCWCREFESCCTNQKLKGDDQLGNATMLHIKLQTTLLAMLHKKKKAVLLATLQMTNETKSCQVQLWCNSKGPTFVFGPLTMPLQESC